MSRGDPRKDRPHARFHGRVEARGRLCAEPGCDAPGEFRAPFPGTVSSGEGPRQHRWLCLDHVRAFNAGYNFFSGMTPEEIHDAQRPYAGWERETRAFASSGADAPPRWADFADPLEAISARARARRPAQRKDGRAVTPDERKALDVLGLPLDSDRSMLRSRYSALVREYHPDRNGGDRSFEKQLQKVVEAYQLLRKAAAFA